MRNLKRALSLGLTAAMISGLMVMGTSAASYADVTSENNVEAIDVLQTVGIMVGDENGNFNPDQNVTRNEMAVIMSNLMEYNVATYKDTSPFTDVPSWAEPYVAACWTNGITSGYSDTIYGGSDTVTTAQAALMLMKALGYFQYASDFGSDWQLATTRQANAIDLFVGVDSGVTAPMTRNDVAQLVLNTLEAGTVEASTDGSWTIGDVTINNNVRYSYITSNQPYAVAISDDRSTDSTTDAGRSIVELGEQLYMGDLQLNDKTSDDFERPSRTWTYDGAEIGTYMKDELIVATYTDGVTGRELYDLLTSSTIREYSLESYLNGSQDTQNGRDVIEKNDLVRSNNSELAQTGNGVLTQVFMDLNDKEITITSVDTWLARANSDYNENSETLSVRIYDTADGTDGSEGQTEVLDLDEIPAIEGVAADQYLLVNRTLKDRTKYETVAISDPEILTGATVTKFSTDDDDDVNPSLFESLTADGTAYDASELALYNKDVLNLYDQDLLTDMTYNVILDQYGYAIGVDLYEGDLNYVFITGYDRSGSHIAINTADAAAIFLDGTMDVIQVNVTNTNKNLDRNNVANIGGVDETFAAKYDKWNTRGEDQVNRWFTYTVTESGVYTLKPVESDRMLVTDYDEIVDADDEKVINCSNVWVADNAVDTANDGTNLTTSGTRGYGNDDSVYITVEAGDVDENEGVADSAITDVTGVYTGVQDVDIVMDKASKANVPNYVYTLVDDDQYIIGSVVLGEAQGSVENYAVILKAPTSEERLSDGTYVWTLDAIMGGEKVELSARSKYQEVIQDLHDAANSNGYGPIVELRMDADGYVTGSELVTDLADFYVPDGMENYEAFDETFLNADVNDLPTLEMRGRTMQIGTTADTTGLTFITDAPTVLRQQINGKWTNTSYASIQDAYNDLADADILGNADIPGLQFKGRIVAVLNNQGVAEWAFIVSETPVNGSDVSYDDNDVTHTNGDATLIVEDGEAYGITSPGVSINRFGVLGWSFRVPAERTLVSYDYQISVNNNVVLAGTETVNDNGLITNSILGLIAYDEGDEVVVYIDRLVWDGVDIPGAVDADLPVSATFEGMPEGQDIANAYAGMPIDIVITNAVMARALPAEGMTEGTQYNVYVNNVLVPNGPYTFENSRLVINDYRITQNDLTAGEIRITDIVAYNSEVDPDETYDITVSVTPEGTATVNIPASAKGGEVVTGTVSVTEGNELVSVTVNGTAVAVAADGTFSFTVSETNAVVVTTKTATPSTSDFTVNVTGTAAAPSFEVEYESVKPTDKQAVIDAINKSLDEKFPESTTTVDDIFTDTAGNSYAMAEGKSVGQITYTGTFKVLYNGVKIGSIEGTAFTPEHPKNTGLADGDKLIVAGTGNISGTGTYSVSVGPSGLVSVTAPTISTAPTADVNLVKGYAVSMKSGGKVTSLGNYSVDGSTPAVATSGNYFSEGTEFTGITGQLTTPTYTNLALKVNGNTVNTATATETVKKDWSYTLDVADLTKADGTTATGFELDEAGITETVINIDGAPITVTNYTTGTAFALPSGYSNLAGSKYIVLQGSANKLTGFSATEDKLVAIDNKIGASGSPETQITIPAAAVSGAYTTEGVQLYLVKAADYTVTLDSSITSYEITYSNAIVDSGVSSAVYLPATGCTIYMGEQNGKDYRIVKTIDSKDDIMTLSNGVATYTVGEDTFAEDAVSKAVSFAKENYQAEIDASGVDFTKKDVAVATGDFGSVTNVTATKVTAAPATPAAGQSITYTIVLTAADGYYVDGETTLKVAEGTTASAGNYNAATGELTFTVTATVAS